VRFKYPLVWLLLLLNILIWLPLSLAIFPTIGVGHDSQLFAPGIHALLRSGNMPWDLMTRFAEARVDIFSYPYFSIVYPFYWTLGFDRDFSYDQHLLLDLGSIFFHMVVASFTFGFFLSRIGCRVSIAGIGAIAYAYSLHMKLWSAWIWAIAAYAWIPLCLLGIWEIVALGRRRTGILYLAVGFGMIALATGVGLVYAVVLSAALMLALWVQQAKTVRLIFVDLRTVVAGGLLGAAIGAVHLIPVLYRMADYIRWYSGGALIGQFKPPYEGTVAQALDWPSGILQLLAPIPGKSVGHLYVGAALLTLAIFLFFRASRWRRAAMVLWFVSLYFLLDTFGDATFVHRINYSIPLLGSIRYPVASALVPVVLITLMACVSLEDQLRGIEKAKSVDRRWLIVLYCVVLASTGGLLFFSADLYQTIFGTGSVTIFMLPAIVALSALAFTLSGRRERWLAILPVAILFAYLPQYSLLVHPKVPDKDKLYNQCDDFVALEESLREWATVYPENTRLLIHLPQQELGGCLSNKKVNSALLQSLALMAGWNVMQPYISPRPYLEFKLFSGLSSLKTIRSHSQLLKAGVSHVLALESTEEISELNGVYEEKARSGSFILYEVRHWPLGQDIAGCIAGTNEKYEIYTARGRRDIELGPALLESGLEDIRCGGAARRNSPERDSDISRHISNSTLRYGVDDEQTFVICQ
jgi:hypothetical protein